jgi:O-antigen ligase
LCTQCCQFLWIVHSSLALQFSLDCPFFIAPSVFSGLFILHCPFSFLWIVHSSLPLQFSLTFLYYRTKCVFEVLVIYLINYNKPIPPWCLSVNATSSPSCLLRNIGTNKTSIKKSPALKGHCCVLSNLF